MQFSLYFIRHQAINWRRDGQEIHRVTAPNNLIASDSRVKSQYLVVAIRPVPPFHEFQEPLEAALSVGGRPPH